MCTTIYPYTYMNLNGMSYDMWHPNMLPSCWPRCHSDDRILQGKIQIWLSQELRALFHQEHHWARDLYLGTVLYSADQHGGSRIATDRSEDAQATTKTYKNNRIGEVFGRGTFPLWIPVFPGHGMSWSTPLKPGDTWQVSRWRFRFADGFRFHVAILAFLLAQATIYPLVTGLGSKAKVSRWRFWDQQL